jgi:hypothetical protein
MKKILPLALLLGLTWGCADPYETARIIERPERAQQPDEATVQIVEEARPAITPGRFDTGKMWTFDNPPLDYFEEAYQFRPGAAWFERARMGSVRFADYCSASFVSPQGLVMTNHHCARESITKVTDTGETLLEDGFYAGEPGAERRVEGLFLDQLLTIRDVTEDIVPSASLRRGVDVSADVRRRRVGALEERLTNEARRQDTTLHVQVIEFYHGAQYSAYTFRRFSDIRLVMSPELRLGYFGGDVDNFTYPRYSLDVAFFRAYDLEGDPLQTDHYFSWSSTGARQGEPVFVVGNPASTSRLITVSQMDFERDHELPRQLSMLASRAHIMRGYIEGTAEGEVDEILRNTYLSLTNSIKALSGQLGGLHDPVLMSRRRAAEEMLVARIASNDTLSVRYGGVVEELARLQRTKAARSDQRGAYVLFGNTTLGSRILTRALYAYAYSTLSQRGAPETQLDALREEALAIVDWPAEVEEAMIALRFEEMLAALGPNDPTIRRILQGRAPAEIARELVTSSALADSAGFQAELRPGYLSGNDPSVRIIQAVAPLFFALSDQTGSYNDQEAELNARLARARFAIFGRDVPPDATFSLRIADGVVAGYEYNGTLAPAFTTFFGLFERHHAHPTGSDWTLPDRWLHAEQRLSLDTPLNIVTTNDITGGNSGSPLLNTNLEVVGLIFDSNMEALPNEFLYTDERARAVSVDVRGITEALRVVYGADRLVAELEGNVLQAGASDTKKHN